jgi:positive regulator of sigma E activity
MSAATGIISLTLLAIAESLSNSAFLWLFVWLPPVCMVMIESSGISDQSVFIATALFNIIYFLIFCYLAVRDYRRSIKELNHSGS